MRLTPVSSIQTAKETQNTTLLSRKRVRFKVKDGERKMQKCVNCGEGMEPYFSRNGATIFMCPNVKLTIKKQKLLSYGFKFCSVSNLNPLMVNPQEAITLYANYQALKEAFKTTTKTLTLQQLRTSTHDTISDVDLLKSVNLALLLGIKENLICELFENGLKLGYAVGLQSKKAIESLSKGLARQSRLILDNIGISFRAETANTWFKAKHDLEKLTSEQTKEAWRGYAIKLIKAKAEDLEIVKEKATQDRLSAEIENRKTRYGKGLRY